jgi:hypothetical protein
MNIRLAIASALLVFLSGTAIQSNGENIVFPSGIGIIDVTKPPYNADNTGKTDVAAILTKALVDNRKVGTWVQYIVYLPNGTYLVKSKVAWSVPPYTVGPHLQGQSRKGTVIKLADSTYRSSTQASYVVQTGADVAQNFNRGMFNLTVNTGKGNPGAIGVFWYANNEALMSDVDIVSEDGSGLAGLRIGTVEEGPACVRKVCIKGFRMGVWSSSTLNTVTLSRITVEGPCQIGVVHEAGFPIYIDSLTTRNTAIAVCNRNTAQLVLNNGYFTGGNPDTAAVLNQSGAMLFARNIVTQGFKQALSSTSGTAPVPSGPNIVEYSSHGCISLFNSPLRSLNLPIKYPPEVAWEQDTSKWANILKYAAGRNDAQALQAAIDDPTKTTVVIPKDKDCSINTAVYVRGTIRRIITSGGVITGAGSLVVDNGVEPAVILEKLNCNLTSFPFIQRSNRIVLMESVLPSEIRHEGTGDLFLSDVICPLIMNNAQAHAWAWGYDAEGGGNQLEVSAGTAWIFGWKDEGTGTSVYQTGGTVEVLGFFNYSNGTAKTMPEIILTGGNFSLASGVQCRYSNKYNILVRQTYGGTTKELLATANPAGFPTTFDIPQFTAYDAASTVSCGPRINAPDLTFDRRGTDGPVVLVRWNQASSPLLLVNSLGRTIRAITPGIRRAEIDVSEIGAGPYFVVVPAGDRRVAKGLSIMR